MVLEKSFAVAHSAHRVAAPVEARVLAAPGPRCHVEKAKGIFCEDTGGPSLLASVLDPSGQGYVAVSTAAMGRTIGDERPRA